MVRFFWEKYWKVFKKLFGWTISSHSGCPSGLTKKVYPTRLLLVDLTEAYWRKTYSRTNISAFLSAGFCLSVRLHLLKPLAFHKESRMTRMTHIDLMFLLLSIQLLALHQMGADSSSINLKSNFAAFKTGQNVVAGKCTNWTKVHKRTRYVKKLLLQL